MSASTVPTRQVSIVPQGVAVGRYLIAKALGAEGFERAKDWRTTPQVAATLEAEYTYSTKSAMNPGSIADATWAAPLAAYGIGGDMIALERGVSIVGQLSGKFRRVPFRTDTPRETGAGTGSNWIGEAAPMPVAQSAFNTLRQDVYKSGTIVVLTRELLRVGDPTTEQTVARTVAAGVAKFIDEQFLTPSVTAVGGLRPAAITNGATAVTSTGGTAAQIAADLAALIQAITTPANGLIWIMRPITAYTIAARLAAVGMPSDLPRTLLGIPLVLSGNSPQQITLLDPSAIVYSDDGAVEIDVTNDATVEMETAPTSPPTAGTVLISLFQENLTGIKVTRWIAYQRAQAGSVAYMTTTY